MSGAPLATKNAVSQARSAPAATWATLPFVIMPRLTARPSVPTTAKPTATLISGHKKLVSRIRISTGDRWPLPNTQAKTNRTATATNPPPAIFRTRATA